MPHSSRLIGALVRVTEAVQSTLDFDEGTKLVMIEGAAALGCDSVGVSYRNRDGWTVTHVHGMPASLVGIQKSDDEERHAVLALETRQPVAVADAFNDKRFNRKHLRRYNIHAVLVVPLILRNDISGVIFFNYQTAPHHFTTPEIDFARQLATTTSIVLENAQMFHASRLAVEAFGQQVADLETANKELARRNRLISARDVRIVKLEKEIDKLCRRFGHPTRYAPDSEAASL